MNRSKIPTIIAIFILVIGVAAGVLLLQQQQIFKLGASPDITPKNTRVTNITDSSFTVSWTTDKQTVGYLKWGTNDKTQEVAHPESNLPSSTHYLNLRNLTPNTTYYFIINSDGHNFDNNGLPWQTQTGPLLSPPASSTIISGKILDANGQPAANAIVYATSGGVVPLSSITSSSGEWIIPLGNARTTSLTSYAPITSNSLLELFVDGGQSGIATAQIYPPAANPTPSITLGRIFDFRNQLTSLSDETPTASIELPTQAAPSSRFQIPEQDLPASDPATVTLDSTKENEVIFTTDPEFFGQGPANTTLTITIQSVTPLTDSITVSPSGNWRFSPTTQLPEGSHTITLSWKDASGIIRSLTRTFTVQAADNEPSFVSTPSGTTATPQPTATATPKPTATPQPTATATPTSTSSPSPTPRVSLPSTDSGLPSPGSTLPTIILSLTGIIFILIGIIISASSAFLT